MLEITVLTPDYQEAMAWTKAVGITPEKLHQLIQTVALKVETKLKEILHMDTKDATGATAASIETWALRISETIVSYKVGSRTRGHILRWLDKGRGWVYPVRARALWIKKGRVEPPIFRAYARPSPPLHVLHRAASYVFSNMDQIIKEVIE